MKFPPGRIVATPGALSLAQSGIYLLVLSPTPSQR